MTANTALGFTYVTPTDKPQVYPAASKALADQLQAFLATTSTAVPTGANIIGSTTTAWKSGKSVTVNVDLTTSAALASGATLFTLPVGWRPPGALFPIAILIQTSAPLRIDIGTDGRGAAQAAVATATTIRGMFEFKLA